MNYLINPVFFHSVSILKCKAFLMIDNISLHFNVALQEYKTLQSQPLQGKIIQHVVMPATTYHPSAFSVGANH